MPDPVLVTGAAGFIGFHFARRLLESGRSVIGVDNLNAYYDPALKNARLAILTATPGFVFRRVELGDRAAVEALFRDGDFGPVAHLAAQAGVRYSLTNPYAYLDANLAGFLNILEGCRARKTPHLLFASSSSVYGMNRRLPFSVHDNVDHPVSLYAATKKANELMAHAYSHLHGLPATGLRFFTVYGPWGRPDMALFIFTKAIVEGRPIQLFGHGRPRRDFTYVDDVVEAMMRLVDQAPRADPDWSGADPGTSSAPWRIFNIGNHTPVEVTYLLSLVESALGKTAIKEFVEMQPGDVTETCADVEDLMRAVAFSPKTPIEEGVARFVAWFREYHGQ